jgi:hypothetical protein
MDEQIGINPGANINRDYPWIYTRLAQYVPWIESIVWADENLFSFKTKVENTVLSYR